MRLEACELVRLNLSVALMEGLRELLALAVFDALALTTLGALALTTLRTFALSTF